MIVAQIGGLRIKYFFDLFRQGVNGPARSEAYINLVFFFLWHAADLQRLTLILPPKDLDRITKLNLLIFFLLLIIQRDRSARLRQSIRTQVTTIIGHELLNARRRNL